MGTESIETCMYMDNCHNKYTFTLRYMHIHTSCLSELLVVLAVKLVAQSLTGDQVTGAFPGVLSGFVVASPANQILQLVGTTSHPPHIQYGLNFIHILAMDAYYVWHIMYSIFTNVH